MAVTEDQMAYWNGPTGEKWVKYQALMDRNLADATAGLIALASPRLGERVLDVGCGAGETSVRLAEMVGPAGSVVGLDISRPLLQRARENSAPTNLTYVEADAAVVLFPPEFDLVISRFGTMFFDNAVAAFSNIRTAIKKGRRFAFVCWRPALENEWISLTLEAARPFLPSPPPFDPELPGPFSLSEPDRIHRILSEAGFTGISTQKLDGLMDLGSPRDAAFQMAQLGPTSRAMRDADPDALHRMENAIIAKFDAHRSGPRVKLGIACWLVHASN